MERIVVGVDGSETAIAALRWAVDEARSQGAELEVVHAWHDPYIGPGLPFAPGTIDPSCYEEVGERVLDAVLERVDTTGLATPLRRVLVHGPAPQMVIEAAKGADLLVLGSRGRGGFAGLLLGSVSQQVIHHAPCPVVVVPPRDLGR